MKKILMLMACAFLLAACSEEAPKTADEVTKEETVDKKEQDKQNEELSQAMTDKYKELHPDDKYVNAIVVWEDVGVIKVKTGEMPEDKKELTMNTVGSVWYQYFREEFTPEHIELWADGANVGTSFDPRFKQ